MMHGPSFIEPSPVNDQTWNAWYDAQAPQKYGSDIPVFAFRMSKEAEESTNYTVFDMSERLRDRGWQMPAYTFPKNCEHIAALRVVVREGFNRDLADLLLEDFERHIAWFKAHPEHKPKKSGHSFRH